MTRSRMANGRLERPVNGDGLMLVLVSRTDKSVRESPITRDWTGREEPKLAENEVSRFPSAVTAHTVDIDSFEQSWN